MTPSNPGGLRSVAKALPAIEVDCSGWDADVPAERWSVGSFRSPSQALPAVVVEWTEVASWLEVVISFDDDTRPGQVVESANRLIGLALAAAPDLGLTYDFVRSRAEGDDVVLALKTNAGADEQRVGRAVQTIQAALSLTPPVRRAVARVRRAA